MILSIDEQNYRYAFSVLMNHEGGLSDDPNDSGGLTKFGLTIQFLKDHNIDVNGDGIIDKDDIYALTISKAKQIYFDCFWTEYQYWRIADVNVATKIFDMAVNMGEITAHKIAQRALNALGQNVAVDGFLGKHSFDAISNVNPRYLQQELRDLSKAHYLDIIEKNPKDKVFENDWLRRAAW